MPIKKLPSPKKALEESALEELKTSEKSQKKPDKPVEKSPSDKELFSTLVDIFVKSNQLLNVYYIDQIEAYDKKTKEEKEKSDYKPPKLEQLKYIEMQMNKRDFIMDKAKLICCKFDKLFLIFPYTYSKIEIRMRNILMNSRDILSSISHFMNFYRVNMHFQDSMMYQY